jgi:NAD(P)-dependent dehydrogenase (short-subunit alcohol dehydrogenase family)
MSDLFVMNEAIHQLFDLTGRVAIITGGCGLLGQRHAEVIARAGGIPVLLDIPIAQPDKIAATLVEKLQQPVVGFAVDITKLDQLEMLRDRVIGLFGQIDILINNAANNPRMEAESKVQFARVENFPSEIWEADIAVGLTGAFLCSRVFGTEMAKQGRGAIVNIASHFALIAPDQRIYRKEGLPEEQQPVKPVTYSVVKAGLLGLTRYLAAYWAKNGVRVNTLCPGGVFNAQPDEFVQRFSYTVPLGRMANRDEYQGAILFLCSDASSYMTGANLVVDGGRTCW